MPSVEKTMLSARENAVLHTVNQCVIFINTISLFSLTHFHFPATIFIFSRGGEALSLLCRQGENTTDAGPAELPKLREQTRITNTN